MMVKINAVGMVMGPVSSPASEISSSEMSIASIEMVATQKFASPSNLPSCYPIGFKFLNQYSCKTSLVVIVGAPGS